MIKFPSIPTVYLVQTGGILHPILDEAVAAQLLGPNWNKLVLDVSEAFYNDYVIDGSITTISDLRSLDQSPSTISGNLNFDGYTEPRLTGVPACEVTLPITLGTVKDSVPAWPFNDVPKDFSFNNDLSSVSGSAIEIRHLQAVLAFLGTDIYPEGMVTGIYGTATTAAVRRFQVRQGLSSVGVVGPATRAALNEVLNKYR